MTIILIIIFSLASSLVTWFNINLIKRRRVHLLQHELDELNHLPLVNGLIPAEKHKRKKELIAILAEYNNNL